MGSILSSPPAQALDPESVERGLRLWQSLHRPGAYQHLGLNTVDVHKNLLEGKRPPFHPAVPKQKVDLINATLSADPVLRPTLRQLAAEFGPIDATLVRCSHTSLPTYNGVSIMVAAITLSSRNNILAVAGNTFSGTQLPTTKLLWLFDASHPTALIRIADLSAQVQNATFLSIRNFFSNSGVWYVRTEDAVAIVWDVERGKEVARVHDSVAPPTVARFAVFSPDDRLVAISRDLCGISIYDTCTWTKCQTLEVAAGYVLDMVFSADGTKLLCACHTHGVVLFRVATGAVLWCVSPTTNEASNYCRAVCWSADEQRVFASAGKEISVRDAETGHEMATSQGVKTRENNSYRDHIECIVRTADSRFLVSSSAQKLILWHVETMLPIHTQNVSGHLAAVASDGATIWSRGHIDSCLQFRIDVPQ